MCVFLGRAMKFFWPQSRGDRPPRPHGSAAGLMPRAHSSMINTATVADPPTYDG